MLDDEQCLFWSTIIDLNPFELKYDPFIVGLDKCSRSCNVLSPKICVPKKTKKTKDINVKVFNMMIIKSKVKTVAKHI